MNDFGRWVQARFWSLSAALKDRQSGATAAEYALLVALISTVIIATVTLLGQQLSIVFGQAEAALRTGGTAR